MTTMAGKRVRLDALLVGRGLAESRMRAQAMVLAGEVYLAHLRASKPGTLVSADAEIEIRSRRPAFVSRGGYKLDHAIQAFGIDVAGRVAIDVGASTGGFTDCLLQRGARLVYAIDVGTGQLAWTLRRDSRVVSLEQRDVRTVTAEELGQPADLATVDVAFISLLTVMPAVMRLVRPPGPIVALLKPQFEVGPGVAKGGVVRDSVVHRATLERSLARLEALGLTIKGVTASPLAGPEGNLEFFFHLMLGTTERGPAIDIESIVASAHETVRVRGRRVGAASGPP